jgi:two-component system cell cycle response regulator
MPHSKLQLPVLLLITDNPAIVHWMRKNLQGSYLLLDAAKEERALQTIQSTSLDFIILDSNFEESDALSLSRKARQINKVVPILLLTGRLKNAYREIALDAGVTDFLNDNLDLTELETRIATGKRAAAEREKAADFSSLIQSPEKKESSHTYFKSRVLLNEKALRLLSDAKKEEKPIALLTLRIDHFQKLEAEYGMIKAENLQQTLAEKIETLLHSTELLIPYSNGRFILLSPQTPPDAARTKAERLRSQIQKEAFPVDGKTIHLTISIAISLPGTGDEEYNLMVANAVKALSQAESMANLILSLDKENS